MENRTWVYVYNNGSTTEQVGAASHAMDYEPSGTPGMTQSQKYGRFSKANEFGTNPVQQSSLSSTTSSTMSHGGARYHTLHRTGRLNWKNFGEIFPTTMPFRMTYEHPFVYNLLITNDDTMGAKTTDEWGRILFETNVVQTVVESQHITMETLQGDGTGDLTTLSRDAAAGAIQTSIMKFQLGYGGVEVMRQYRLYFVNRMRVKMALTQLASDPDASTEYASVLQGFTMYTKVLNAAEKTLVDAGTDTSFQPVNDHTSINTRHDVSAVYYPEKQLGTSDRTIHYQFDFISNKAHANVEVDEMVGTIAIDEDASNGLTITDPTTVNFGEIGWILDAHRDMITADGAAPVMLRFKAHVTVTVDVILFERDTIHSIVLS